MDAGVDAAVGVGSDAGVGGNDGVVTLVLNNANHLESNVTVLVGDTAVLLCVVSPLHVAKVLIHDILVVCTDAIDCVVDVTVSAGDVVILLDNDVIASSGESITC